MTVFAYLKASSTDKNTATQFDAIKNAYPDAVVRKETKVGSNKANRGVLTLLLNMMSHGDKLVIWKLDRLATSLNDLTNIVNTLTKKGVSLEVLNQDIRDNTASQKAFLDMLSVFTEFENNSRKERQLAGIAKAKRERPEAYTGRKATIDGEQIKHLLAQGLTPTEVAKKLKIGRATVYRYR
jgi:DNA invertase Pin-like site-specific DNA recombinase